ncbi:exosortase V [Rhizorhapis sp. SPR117]|uniref:exosortase V n=1 Tax=Rhizorhapis sp. SPR117 TaxID=2912611 RepID=UPI001F25A4EA|nr:exosortase V [Rhizorhapis sp. SPR117]
MLFGLAALVLPTLVSLARLAWSTEAGAHGPIVLATGLWLFWRRWPELMEMRRPGNSALTVAAFLGMLPFYIFGRAYDFLFIEAGALFGALCVLFYGRFGGAAMCRHWFLLVYMAFLVQPPGWAMDSLTAPLKAFVSAASSDFMRALGFPVYREGVTLYISQYQLLVEDACSGLNSLVGLTSISLFYIYVLRETGWRYSLLLTGLIVPVAVLANIVRISMLVLLTYYFGDSVVQGFLHFAPGFLLFALSLALIFGIDAGLGRLLGLRERRL